MEVPTTEFINIIPKGAVFQAIQITGYNLKLVYEYLKDKGCVVIPDEKQSFGKIWVYDPEVQDCVSYDPEEFYEFFLRSNHHLQSFINT